MKYRDYIEKYFLIDEPRSGQLVPFQFRPVQNKYYDTLVREYDIENKGLMVPVRELILKARREVFTSLILALFAVDDLTNDNPTETLIISYKDDATQTFRKRYRTFLTSAAARRSGLSFEDIQHSPGIHEEMAKKILSVDSTEIELRHNKAHFYCGTASARVGGRGGVVQKLLFSEAAFYPDKKELRAKEIIEGTMRQVDISSGWAFVESTANGDNNYYAKMWTEASLGNSRFRPRFFSWKEFYTDEQFEIIKSEFTDKRMIPQEFPGTAEEAFLSSGDRFFDPSLVQNLVTDTPQTIGQWNYYGDFIPGHRYALGADVSEGVGRHNSTVVIMDFDALVDIGDRKIHKPKVIALYTSNTIPPDLFAHEIKAGGLRYGSCIAAPERNNHGFATLTILKDIYYNIYKEPNTEKLGWYTTFSSKPKMMHELRTALHEELIEISDASLKQEIISYPSTNLNLVRVDELDETEGHYDRVIALAICWQLRSLATYTEVPKLTDLEKEKTFDKYALFSDL